MSEQSTDISQIQAYGCSEPTIKLKEVTIPIKRPLGHNEVLIRVLCCGICHSDIHVCADDWGSIGMTFFGSEPCCLVAGHEVIARVVAVGKTVSDLKLGDRVGCGPIRNSCGECIHCTEGNDQFCVKLEGLFSPTETGGFGEYMMMPSAYCFKIPDALPTREAAPLLCAGLTTYTPLVNSHIRPGAKVGVLGVGGLGLLAVRYSIALGYETYAFTTSSDKAEYLKGLGCKDVILYKTDQDQVKSYLSTFDFILNTVSAQIDVNFFLSLLKPKGELCVLGLGTEISINTFALVGATKRVSGSYTGSRNDMKNMLEFSAKHNIYPVIEVAHVPFGQDSEAALHQAFQKVQDGDVRYRMVLDFGVDDESVINAVTNSPIMQYHVKPVTE